MWNNLINSGNIWSTKSINQYDNFYDGMTYGNSYILILSAYRETNSERKFTYLKISKMKKENRNQIIWTSDKNTYYIDIENLYTGNQNALEYYIETVDRKTFKDIIKSIQIHFNLVPKSNKRIESKQVLSRTNITNTSQEKIHKFGIDIYVIENEHVQITKSKKLRLSEKAKEDIIYNSKTDEDIFILSNKYQIFPIKAIKEIRNRLVYQHKQKEG